MTTAALIALFVAVVIVMTAAGRWRLRTKGGLATSHNEDKIFQSAPYWANTLNQKLNTLIAGQRRLHQHIGSEADADERRDTKMSAETQAAIDELKAEVAQNTDATASVVAVIDGLIERFEAAGNDPAEIRAEIAAMKTNRDALAAAALKGTPIDPSGN